MQQTALPRSDTARRTGNRGHLFCRQVARSHLDTVPQNQPQNCSILNIFPTSHRKVSFLPDNCSQLGLPPARDPKPGKRTNQSQLALSGKATTQELVDSPGMRKQARSASAAFVRTRHPSPRLLVTAHYPRLTLFMYPELMLDEKAFQRKADAAFDDLKKRLLVLGDEHGFDVEGEAGKLEVTFEEPEEAKFVISPNTPVREIWISALSTSFKLGWNESRNAFVHEKTGEDLYAVMSRVVSQQLGTQVTL